MARSAARLAWLVMSLLASAGAALGAPADDVVSRGWTVLRTPHLEVVTDANREVSQRVASQLEDLREAFAKATPGFLVETAPVQVFVFREPAMFKAYAPRWRGSRDELGGFFLPGTDHRRVFFPVMQGRTLSLAQHEYVHALLEASLPELPLWLNEGLAEYWSSFRTEHGTGIAGKPIDAHVHWLKRNNLIPLEKLFSMTHASPDYHEGDRRGTFYAQAWALVHLLLSSPEDVDRLDRCLIAFRDGQAFDVAFAREFGPEVALRERVRSHIDKARHKPRKWALETPDSTELLEPRPLSPAAVLASLGNALLAHDPPQRTLASQHLERASRLEPRNAEADAGLGWLEALADRPEAARARWVRAVRAYPVSAPAVRLATTEWLSLMGVLEDRLSRPVAVDEMRRALQRARKAAPGDPELLSLLARTWVVEPGQDAEPGYVYAQQAVAALPGRTDARLDLLALAALTGRLDEAKALAERYFARDTRPGASRYVRRALFAGEVLAVNRLILDERYASADSLLRQARARVSGDPELTTEADAFIARLHRHRREVEEINAENSAIEAYNAGVELANLQRPAEAANEFRRAESVAASDTLKAQARDMVRRMQVRVRTDEAVALAQNGHTADAIAMLEALLKPGLSQDERRSVEQTLASLRARAKR